MTFYKYTILKVGSNASSGNVIFEIDCNKKNAGYPYPALTLNNNKKLNNNYGHSLSR